MVGDLFHLKHLKLLEMAADYGRSLAVGVYNDSTAHQIHNDSPFQTLSERIEIIRACRYVDEVILNAPAVVSEEFMEENGIDLVVHSDDGNSMLIADRYKGAIARNGQKTVTMPKEARDAASIVERVLNKHLHKRVDTPKKVD